ncbi:AAA family ATPase [Pseudalkalibacillus salsuginis]|uniref:AAA family ATPase n=1 Tax=Pseudalkalibacillus salsuginis TaxID=2910972 RepID=UPI001F2D329E|nr:MoxR family ATPase [Pseudalkalibacillus salsuginis]MCF6408358.1 MoxR family ATPase [Pseudalkalibacillus salsuginis]
MKMKLEEMKKSIGKVLIGKEESVEFILVALLARGHVLMEDVPGTGKTMLAKSIAKSIAGSFRRVQFTPDVLPSDVTGIQYLNPKTREFETRFGPVMTNVLLADEINRATPRTQSSLLEVMEERQVTIDVITNALPDPFIVLATQNPIESHGTFPLPEAQMDRFLLKLNVGYPSLQEERQMMRAYRNEEPIEKLKPVFTTEEIVFMQKMIKEVRLSEEIEEYILRIILETRKSKNIEVGVSPRGTLAFMRALQAYAWLHGRDYVIPEDCKKLAPVVLAHRLVLSMEGELRKTQLQIIMDILDVIEVPVESGAINQ